MIRDIVQKIQKKFKIYSFDDNLLSFYQNPETNSLNEFQEDLKIINDLRKTLKKYTNGYDVPFLSIYNKYTLIKNVFGKEGLTYIACNYFSEDESLFSAFCSLIWYFDKIRLDNWLSDRLIKKLESEDITKNRG